MNELACNSFGSVEIRTTGNTLGWGEWYPNYHLPNYYLPWPAPVPVWPTPYPVYVPVPTPLVALPVSVGGWTVVGHCHKCDNPIYAQPSFPDPPQTRRSCDCHP